MKRLIGLVLGAILVCCAEKVETEGDSVNQLNEEELSWLSWAESCGNPLARELNRRIGWFADPLEHTKLLLSLSNIEPNQLISHTIKQTESHYYNLENLYKLWRSGNNEELAKIVFSSFEYSPEVMETLVYQRNREWAEKILEFANDEKNYFIVVGTGHLIGKDSLVDLLEKEGISFKQKKFNQI